MAVPRPQQVFDPVARALDFLGDKWTLVLVGHLLRGPRGFQELRVRTGIAPRVLSSRLRKLQALALPLDEVAYDDPVLEKWILEVTNLMGLNGPPRSELRAKYLTPEEIKEIEDYESDF